jgi:thymidine kinase
MIKEGYLEVFCGPMNCGKSRELITRLDKLRYIQGTKYLLVKPQMENRTKNVKSRFGGLELDCFSISESNPEELFNLVKKSHSVIGFEEAQFFDERVYFVIQELLLKKKHILVSGLDLDFRGEPFGPMPKLLSIANEVHKLTAICEYLRGKKKCNSLATRTQRLINGKPAPYNSSLILVGDKKEGYQSRCLSHHFVPGRPKAYFE